MVCQRINQMVSQVTQPLNQSLYRSANLDLFLPGAGLGGLGGGINISAGRGMGAGGSPLNVGYTNTLGGGSGGSIIGNSYGGSNMGAASKLGPSLFGGGLGSGHETKNADH